jgi:hypothetical protein
LIDDVMNKAQENTKLWNKDPSEAIKRAAEDLVTKHIGNILNAIPNRPPYVKPPHVSFEQNVKLARTAIKKALSLKNDPRLKYLNDPDNAMDELEDLFEELKEVYEEKKI